MLHPARIRLACAALLAAAGLTGCMTPRAEPELSQAVLDARAGRNAPASQGCAQQPLTAVSPATVGFAFNEAKAPDALPRALAAPVLWLACHPQAAAAILPDADGHGGPAEQDDLARRRAEAVRDYLAGQNIPAARIQILRRGAAEPKGEVVVIRAEGRRW